MIKKIGIIGANDFQRQLVIKAKEMGYETHVFAWEEGAVAKDIANKFYPISIIEKEQILKISKNLNLDGITSIASDLAVPTVNYIANKLNLVGNSYLCSEVSTNKYKMIERFKSYGVPCPKFKLVDKNFNNKDLDFEFPIIVKPIDRSGSRGIYQVHNSDELEAAILGAIEVSFDDKVLIEEFIQGNEYSMEMISYKGEHHFLATTKKFTTGSPNFIETAHMQPADLNKEVEEKAIRIVKKALDSLEIKYGASHSEFKIDKNNNIKIIEIGSRMGGDCIGSDLVEISTGYDFKRMVLDIALGKEPYFKKVHNENNVAFIKFIFNEEDLNILKNIEEKHPEKIYRVSEIDKIGSRIVKDSSTRYGYFILKCSTEEECSNLVNII